MFIITILYLRSRLCGVICKFHFFSLDFIEALFTVYVSVRKKPICPFSVIFEGDDEDDENAIYNSITAQAENNWGKEKNTQMITITLLQQFKTNINKEKYFGTINRYSTN